VRRFHLFEIEDQPWCPASVRDGATDYLQFVLAKTQPYRAIAARLADAIRSTGDSQVIDLCSGAGGPWLELLPHVSAGLSTPLKVVLTDCYPNIQAFQRIHMQSKGKISYIEQPVDACSVPESLPGFRTLFSGFHHFGPQNAVRILKDTTSKGHGIGIFEATERRTPSIIGMLFVPLIIAAVTPAIRPFHWHRLLWTYLLPVIPLVGLFDGIVSCLRTYTVQELKEMVKPFADYKWDIGLERLPGMPSPVTYAIGYPNKVN
jgi:hypothetical protein